MEGTLCALLPVRKAELHGWLELLTRFTFFPLPSQGVGHRDKNTYTQNKKERDEMQLQNPGQQNWDRASSPKT